MKPPEQFATPADPKQSNGTWIRRAEEFLGIASMNENWRRVTGAGALAIGSAMLTADGLAVSGAAIRSKMLEGAGRTAEHINPLDLPGIGAAALVPLVAVVYGDILTRGAASGRIKRVFGNAKAALGRFTRNEWRLLSDDSTPLGRRLSNFAERNVAPAALGTVGLNYYVHANLEEISRQATLLGATHPDRIPNIFGALVETMSASLPVIASNNAATLAFCGVAAAVATVARHPFKFHTAPTPEMATEALPYRNGPEQPQRLLAAATK